MEAEGLQSWDHPPIDSAHFSSSTRYDKVVCFGRSITADFH
ncbi:hypothetical protein [Dysgonomonas sp. BGC7]|nr:hypothetical protein [Dysgonomonas sp. BGC7]